MFARSGGEDSFGGFPPESPDAHLASFAGGFCALVDEDLLHFRAEVAAEFGGEQAEEHAEAFCGAAFGLGHDVPHANLRPLALNSVRWIERARVSRAPTKSLCWLRSL